MAALIGGSPVPAISAPYLAPQVVTQRTETWDHDHCAGCWAEFAEFEGSDILHEGYATGADYPKGAAYWWVCPTCFTDLEATLGCTAANDHQ
jgi:hypothetical protein